MRARRVTQVVPQGLGGPRRNGSCGGTGRWPFTRTARSPTQTLPRGVVLGVDGVETVRLDDYVVDVAPVLADGDRVQDVPAVLDQPLQPRADRLFPGSTDPEGPPIGLYVKRPLEEGANLGVVLHRRQASIGLSPHCLAGTVQSEVRPIHSRGVVSLGSRSGW